VAGAAAPVGIIGGGARSHSLVVLVVALPEYGREWCRLGDRIVSAFPTIAVVVVHPIVGQAPPIAVDTASAFPVFLGTNAVVFVHPEERILAAGVAVALVVGGRRGILAALSVRTRGIIPLFFQEGRRIEDNFEELVPPVLPLVS